MHGAGNDFVVIDHREPFLPAQLEPLVARWCDRRRGIGADGVLLLERDDALDFAMRYFNADGRPAEYCGNGARCLARLALELGLGDGQVVRFRTAAGTQRARRDARSGGIEVSFGAGLTAGDPCDVEACGRSFTGRFIRAGVPHFVTEVERVEGVPIEEWGPGLRRHERFAPDGVNVDFVTPLGPQRLAIRTFERGVESETLACGSGAIASALWAAARHEVPEVTVLTAGGDELVVTLTHDGGTFTVTISGPAEVAFSGEWQDPAIVAAKA